MKKQKILLALLIALFLNTHNNLLHAKEYQFLAIKKNIDNSVLIKDIIIVDNTIELLLDKKIDFSIKEKTKRNFKFILKSSKIDKNLNNPVKNKNIFEEISFENKNNDVILNVNINKDGKADISNSTDRIVIKISELPYTEINKDKKLQFIFNGTPKHIKSTNDKAKKELKLDFFGVSIIPEIKYDNLNVVKDIKTEKNYISIIIDSTKIKDIKTIKKENNVIISYNENKEIKVIQEKVIESGSKVDLISYQFINDKALITVKTNKKVDYTKYEKDNVISIRIHDSVIDKNLLHTIITKDNSNILRITPINTIEKNKEVSVIKIIQKTIDKNYSIKQENDVITIELANNMVEKAKPILEKKEEVGNTDIKQTEDKYKKIYNGKKITLEFTDADIRKILQLLSEVSSVNFLLGDEVTGNVTMKLNNVPWEQALDLVVETKGFEKRLENGVMIVRGKGKFKNQLEAELDIKKEKLKAEPLIATTFNVNYADLGGIVSQFTTLKTERGSITQDPRTNKIIVRDVQQSIDDMNKILTDLDVPEKQVMIEARIVEASTAFTKSLGINWGLHYKDGSASILGIDSLDTSFGGLAQTAAPLSGVSGSSGGTADVSFGTLASNIKINLRLNAAATAGQVKIISTPKVATLNHKSAKITQGQQIPYTSSTSDKVETKFVEAALSLEVTPHINPNGTIVMKIDAKNDSPGSGGTPPPINKKQATTEMLLNDGETTVIGGIYIDRDNEGSEGVPWLMDVPWLGGLFKSKATEKTRTELLIFITPRILQSNVPNK